MKHSISHAEMVTRLVKSGDVLKEELTPYDCRLIHCTWGIVGELGELAGGIDIASGTGRQPDRQNIVEELGDIEFFLADFRTVSGITYDEIMTCPDVCIVPDRVLRKSYHMLIYATDLMDHVKKHVIYRQPLNRIAVLTNLSKIEYILGAFRTEMRISREETLEANMDKLAIRYPGFEYTDLRAKARADKEATNLKVLPSPEQEHSAIVLNLGNREEGHSN